MVNNKFILHAVPVVLVATIFYASMYIFKKEVEATSEVNSTKYKIDMEECSTFGWCSSYESPIASKDSEDLVPVK